MASHLMTGQPWPDGTAVSVYPAEAQTAGASGPPAGGAVASESVSDGTVVFTGLAEARRYVAYAAGKSIGFLIPDRPHGNGDRARIEELEGNDPGASLPDGRTVGLSGPWALSADGTWTWFTNPRAVCHAGTYRRLYTGYIRADGDVCISSYDLDSAVVEEFVLHAALEADDHDTPSIYVRPDGRIVAFYCTHATDGIMRWRISTYPEDVSTWGPEHTYGNALFTCSYSNPHYLSSEAKLYLFTRSLPPAPGTGGSRCPTMLRSTDGGVTFDAQVPVFLSGTGTIYRPYVQYASDGVSRIHFIASLGHPRDTTAGTCHLYHWYYEAGNLYKTDGTPIRTLASLTTTGPLTPSEVTKVYDATADKGSAVNGNAWPWSIELDGTGKPVITYSVFSAIDDNRYQWAQWTGSTWSKKQLLAGVQSLRSAGDTGESQYAGGIHLDPRDTNTVYLSRIVAGQWEIEKWRTADAGTIWTQATITEASLVKNFRPYVPRGWQEGCPEVVWCRGRYDNWQGGGFDTDVYAPAKLAAEINAAAEAASLNPTNPHNVMDYGAVGDGTSHPLSESYATLAEAQVVFPFVTALTQERDGAAWQAAANAGAATGRAVYGPAPSVAYIIDREIGLETNAYIYGDGWDTLLQMKGACADGLSFRMFVPRNHLTAVTTGIIIRDLHLDGQAILQNLGGPILNPNNTHHGISLRNAERCRVTRVWAENFDGDGIYMGRDTASTPTGGGKYNVVEGCYTNRNVRNGMMVGCGSFNVIRGNLFDGNQVGMRHDSPKYAPQYYASGELDLEPNSAIEHCDYNLVEGNIFQNGWWVGVQITRPTPTEDGNIVRNNKFINMRGTFLHGLGTGAVRTLVEGNSFVSSGTTVTGTADTLTGDRFLRNVSPTTGWQNGMRISGPGIPLNTAILSGAGTPTMEMTTISGSVAHSPSLATATASGVAISGTTNSQRFLRFTEGNDSRVVRNVFLGAITSDGSSHAIDIDDAGGGARPARPVVQDNIFDFAGASGNSASVRLLNCDDGRIGNNRYLNGAFLEQITCTGMAGFSGEGLRVREGTTGQQGVVTLVAGVKVVNLATITAVSRIFINRQTDGGTVGAGYSHTRTPGTGFTIQAKDGAGANQALDTSIVAYEIFEPA